jgi:hypothetical protein
VQGNHQPFFWRHTPGMLDLFVREPLAQLTGSPSETLYGSRLLGYHAAKYMQVSGRLKG